MADAALRHAQPGAQAGPSPREAAGTPPEPRVQTVLLADPADVTALKLLAVTRSTTVSHLVEAALAHLLGSPSRRPPRDSTPRPSVRVCITLPPALHHALRVYAVTAGVSQRAVLDQVVHDVLTPALPTAQVVAIANPHPGSGKTLTTALLAHTLRRRHQCRVLVVDLDPAAAVTHLLGADLPPPGPTLAEVLLAEPPEARAPHVAIEAGSGDHPALLAGGAWLAHVEARLALATSREALRRLAGVVESLAPAYDVILLDCPPNLGSLTLSALVAADWLLVPAAPGAGWGVAQLAAAVADVRRLPLTSHLALLSVVWTQGQPGDDLGMTLAAPLTEALEPLLPAAPMIPWSPAAGRWLTQGDIPAGYEAVAAALVAAGRLEAPAEGAAVAGDRP